MRTSIVILAVLGALLAGCTQPQAATKEATTLPSAPTISVLYGHVTDDEIRPLAGAVLAATLGNDTVAVHSGDEGDYRIELPLGTYAMRVSLAGFHDAYDTVVLGGAELHLDFALTPIPQIVAYNDTFSWTGSYDCAMEAVILTGDCMILYETYSGQGEDPVTKESNETSFQVGANWTQVVVELVWQPGAQSQVDGAHLYLASDNGSAEATGHRVKYAIAEGSSNPLRIDLMSSAAHATAEKYPGTQTLAKLPEDGGSMFLIVYPRGKFAETAGSVCEPPPSSRCFLGAGAAFDMTFTAHISIFYNGPAPVGYSALG